MSTLIMKTVRGWLPFAVVITLFAGIVYVGVQQVLRQTANDPQIQMAEDAAAALAAGAPLGSAVTTSAPLDMARSLTPYVLLYDVSGQPVAGSARLHGSLPALPPGVFDYVRQHGEDRITWQPEPGVRSATVIVPYSSGAGSGFVLAGRSLRETERREDDLLKVIAVGWLGTLIAALVAVAAGEFVPSAWRFLVSGAQGQS